MRFYFLLIIVLFQIFLSGNVKSARIMVMYPGASKSHKFAVLPIVEALAAKGHQITFFSPFQPSKQVENIDEIVLHRIAEAFQVLNRNWFEQDKQGAFHRISEMSQIQEIIKTSYQEIMSNPEFRSILNERRIDLILCDAIYLNEFSLVVGEYLRVPVVMHSSASAVPLILKAVGAPMDYASVPSIITNFDEQMTFFERLINMVVTEVSTLVYRLTITRLSEDLMGKDFPNSRPIEELEKETDLLILNSNPTTAYARSLPPSVLTLGGLHCRPAQTLPTQFRTFVDRATDGFIIFSLGSFVSVSSMPKEILQVFLNVFAQIPQRVVWKWEGQKPENISPNIMMNDWLPQQDLLGHPSARVFITHGGLLGVQETIYHGIPILGLPFANDQTPNIARAVKLGCGLGLEWKSLNEYALRNALTRLLNEPSFKSNATKLSRLMRDELMPSKDVAVYWIEHVLRHGGTKHLQLTGKDMPFYKRHLLDVVTFLLAVSLVILFLTYHLLRLFLLKCVFNKKQNAKQKFN